MKKVLMLGLGLLLAAETARATEEDWCCIPVIKQAFMAFPRAGEELKQLLADGADPNTATSSGHTALMVAAGRGRVQAMRILLEAGADARATAHANQETALHCLARTRFPYCAICAGHTPEQAQSVMQHQGKRLIEGADLLLAAGADVNARDAEGRTPFVLALQNSLVLAEYLLQHGAGLPEEGSAAYQSIIDGLAEGKPCSLPLLLRAGLGVETRLPDGHSLLMAAARYAHVDAVKMLLELGADVHYEAKNGTTALRQAMRLDTKQGFSKQRSEVVRLLLAAGANPMLMPHGNNAFHSALWAKNEPLLRVLLEQCPQGLEVPDDQGRTPLMIAAQSADEACLRLLLEKGANVHACDKSGYTALAYAARCRIGGEYHYDRMELLREYGADVAKEGPQAMVLACQSGTVKAVRWLLAAGMDAKAGVGPHGNTLLHVATHNEHGGIIELLIKNGADVHAKNSVGNTALHFAMTSLQPNRWHVVSVLLREGADPHLRNNYGMTPLDTAPAEVRAQLQQLLGIIPQDAPEQESK
ncbi:MAG: ankyrin repeat domain-containing protein [Akkermansia sp.]|nr:ankyrin repeat domain-containing protein [Akkermansia sp.]